MSRETLSYKPKECAISMIMLWRIRASSWTFFSLFVGFLWNLLTRWIQLIRLNSVERQLFDFIFIYLVFFLFSCVWLFNFISKAPKSHRPETSDLDTLKRLCKWPAGLLHFDCSDKDFKCPRLSLTYIHTLNILCKISETRCTWWRDGFKSHTKTTKAEKNIKFILYCKSLHTNHSLQYSLSFLY